MMSRDSVSAVPCPQFSHLSNRKNKVPGWSEVLKKYKQMLMKCHLLLYLCPVQGKVP